MRRHYILLFSQQKISVLPNLYIFVYRLFIGSILAMKGEQWMKQLYCTRAFPNIVSSKAASLTWRQKSTIQTHGNAGVC